MTAPAGHPSDARVPPQALEVESAVLGAMLMAADAVTAVRGILSPEHFYKPANRKIYEAMITISGRGDPVDMATVRAELEREGALEKIGGPGVIIDLADSVLTAAYAETHARLILEKATLRRIVAFGQQLSEKCANGAGELSDVLQMATTDLTAITVMSRVSKHRETIGECMNDIESEEVDWLWYPWLPLGKITILEGNPGEGKTTLALQLAAIISRGWPFPDAGGRPGIPREPASVIVMNSEDGLADTLRPRLDRAQADCTRIFALMGVRVQDKGRSVDRSIGLQDVLDIEEEIVKHQARLLIVDPLQAYLGASVDMSQANETRPILSAIGNMAGRNKCAVLMIRHLRKTGGRPVERGLGSIDFFGAARSVAMTVQDPDNEGQYLIAHSKCTLAPKAKSQGYTLTDGFAWTSISSRTADDLAAAPLTHKEASAVTEAEQFLQRTLASGPVAAKEVIAIARREGISQRTLEAAKAGLSESKKIGNFWFWQLRDPATKPIPAESSAETGEFGPPIVLE